MFISFFSTERETDTVKMRETDDRDEKQKEAVTQDPDKCTQILCPTSLKEWE